MIAPGAVGKGLPCQWVRPCPWVIVRVPPSGPEAAVSGRGAIESGGDRGAPRFAGAGDCHFPADAVWGRGEAVGDGAGVAFGIHQGAGEGGCLVRQGAVHHGRSLLTQAPEAGVRRERPRGAADFPADDAAVFRKIEGETAGFDGVCDLRWRETTERGGGWIGAEASYNDPGGGEQDE